MYFIQQKVYSSEFLSEASYTKRYLDIVVAVTKMVKECQFILPLFLSFRAHIRNEFIRLLFLLGLAKLQ